MLVETWNLAFPFVLLVLSLEVIFRMAASRNFPGKKRNSTLLKTTVCSSKWWKFTQVIQLLVKSSKMTFFWWLFRLQFVSVNKKKMSKLLRRQSASDTKQIYMYLFIGNCLKAHFGAKNTPTCFLHTMYITVKKKCVGRICFITAYLLPIYTFIWSTSLFGNLE